MLVYLYVLVMAALWFNHVRLKITEPLYGIPPMGVAVISAILWPVTIPYWLITNKYTV